MMTSNRLECEICVVHFNLTKGESAWI